MSPRHNAAEARQTRQTIIDRAVRVASVEGLDGLTIGRLADDLGLSKAGVVGPFGSKEELQLAAFREAMRHFRRYVWDPAADRPAGRERLTAVCGNWIDYLRRRELPGGCMMTTAACEWDARPGALHEAVAASARLWLGALSSEVEVAVRAGELPADADPQQVAFELNGIGMSLNHAVQLFDDPRAPERARKAIARVLTTERSAAI